MRAKAGSWLVNSSVVMLCRSPGLWRGLCLSTVWIELFQWGDPYWAPADLAPEAYRGERVQMPELREEVPREAGLAETVRMLRVFQFVNSHSDCSLCLTLIWICMSLHVKFVSMYPCVFESMHVCEHILMHVWERGEQPALARVHLFWVLLF